MMEEKKKKKKKRTKARDYGKKEGAEANKKSRKTKTRQKRSVGETCGTYNNFAKMKDQKKLN